MKSNKVRCLLLTCITLSFLFTLMAIEVGDPINLFENPSLDVDANLDGEPDCWNLSVNYPNNYYLDEVEKYDGTQSLRMETYNTPSTPPDYMYLTGSGGIQRWFDVEPNKTYTLSYWVKTEQPQVVRALPNTWEYDVEGNLIGQHYSYVPLSLGWQRIIFPFTTFPGTVRMSVTVRIWADFSEYVYGWKEGEFYTSWIDAVQIEESETASPFHIDFPSCPSTVLPATFDIYPNTLSLVNEGEMITCYIALPDGFDVGDIDVSTVLFEGTVYAEPEFTEIGDFHSDSIIELMAKFDRSAVINYLLGIDVQNKDEVVITITGYLHNGTPFEGTDIIRVMR